MTLTLTSDDLFLPGLLGHLSNKWKSWNNERNGIEAYAFLQCFNTVGWALGL